ncbi:PhoH family protein [Paenibacillus vortex V453]|uniref:PhoH family protein n=1 Tax=Paenibacillus vortex V453 TaxID=715225 RepID=A0A2R9T2L9_9BACL|nr:PIN domain-containing protein [Paenibacillus vortex]EFU43846.1 PhoH family protein [Paenibacillus vortex V453]
MKKRWITNLFLLTGLFTWNVTAFASENVIQIIEAQHDKSALFIRLFISLVALVLYIGICRTALLFLHYKEIFGAKDALARILFNSRSLATTNVRNLKQNVFLQQYKKAISEKIGQGNAFGLDTNILMHYPTETFEILKKENIVMSREVQKELDGLKNSSDKETSSNARRAFKAIEDAQRQGQSLTILPSVDFKTLTQLNLADTMDDRILAAYLQLHKQGKPIYFLTNDRGAKITARNAGMPIVEIEQSTKQVKNPWIGLVAAGILGIILLVGLVGYNAFAFFQANSQVGKGFSLGEDSVFDKASLKTSTYDEIIEKINLDSNHIYNPSHADQFVQPTQQGYDRSPIYGGN